MAAYSYRNVLTGSLVSSLQINEDAIYDDILGGYVYDDLAANVIVVDDYAPNPLNELLKTAIKLKNETLTLGGQILQLKSNSSPIFVDGPTLKDLSLRIISITPVDNTPKIELKELSLVINGTPIEVPPPSLQQLSLTIISTSTPSNPGANTVTPPANTGPTLQALTLTISN